MTSLPARRSSPSSSTRSRTPRQSKRSSSSPERCTTMLSKNAQSASSTTRSSSSASRFVLPLLPHPVPADHSCARRKYPPSPTPPSATPSSPSTTSNPSSGRKKSPRTPVRTRSWRRGCTRSSLGASSSIMRGGRRWRCPRRELGATLRSRRRRFSTRSLSFERGAGGRCR